ncbi:alanine--tRNA ligase [Orbus sturtevantii]|uniref:alanine--tRNA ligase n=1 Tax=Orbus sturtevantii TaxID=3074109 RepID=UPI00370DC96F
MKSTAEIRQMFLDFFHGKGHEVVESSSLVPHNDPTLLFTNAGMNQFKDVFLGMDKRSYSRATTSQRCVRAGGKHNDLDNVGYTARHHTFFEMLGNFSFGDYFKRDAIHFAWELLTGEGWLNLPKDKLLVTVYATDDEAFNIWANEIGVPSERIIRIGDNKGAPYASDNFWQMGDTGPCGPCSEIFYDHGDHIWGGPPGSAEEDGDRFIEIWNIVFMQFNRLPDGSMETLPKPSVDTGMGLERISAVLQHVNSNYDIDLFKRLIKDTAQIIGVDDLESKSLRVIADHIRSCAFLIADGVMPSNEGRGYVLRRIIRRAVRHGNMLGAKEIFFYKLVTSLINVMGSAANHLAKVQKLVEETLKVEEEQFLKTLERGLLLLDQELKKVSNHQLSGDVAFKLYDTFGFPLDLTADVCREKNITIDEARFNQCMDVQRQRSRESDSFTVDYSSAIKLDAKTEFLGYEMAESTATVVAIFQKGTKVDTIKPGEESVIILDKTPFYAESGGQVGDKGLITTPISIFNVTDSQKYGQSIGHIGSLLKGQLNVGDKITAAIDSELRARIRRNHSATHLLQAALQRILGEHIAQKGSLVNDGYLRFDFSHMHAIDAAKIQEIENLVNQQIRRNLVVSIELMPIEQAKNSGAMALFGEKYDDIVRVLTMGDFSIELCGGTHVERTGDIGFFKIISESSIASGVRRIEATTGQMAVDLVHDDDNRLNGIMSIIKADKINLIPRLSQLVEQTKQLEKEIEQLKSIQAAQESVQLINQVEVINGKKLLVAKIYGTEAKILRQMIDDLKNQLKSAVIILAAINDDKISLAVGVTNDLTAYVKAGILAAKLADRVGGKGGGRPDFAQAGGTNISVLPNALSSIKDDLVNELKAI